MSRALLLLVGMILSVRLMLQALWQTVRYSSYWILTAQKRNLHWAQLNLRTDAQFELMPPRSWCLWTDNMTFFHTDEVLVESVHLTWQAFELEETHMGTYHGELALYAGVLHEWTTTALSMGRLWLPWLSTYSYACDGHRVFWLCSP